MASTPISGWFSGLSLVVQGLWFRLVDDYYALATWTRIAAGWVAASTVIRQPDFHNLAIPADTTSVSAAFQASQTILNPHGFPRRSSPNTLSQTETQARPGPRLVQRWQGLLM
jgi:hypothetical protein